MAKSGPQTWVHPFAFTCFHEGSALYECVQDYCAPKVNYFEVRTRVAHAFAGKANEMADAISVVQNLSKGMTRLLEKIDTHCGASLEAAASKLEQVDFALASQR